MKKKVILKNKRQQNYKITKNAQKEMKEGSEQNAKIAKIAKITRITKFPKTVNGNRRTNAKGLWKALNKTAKIGNIQVKSSILDISSLYEYEFFHVLK